MIAPSKLTRLLAIGLLAASAIAGAACSSDGSDGSSKTSASTTVAGDAAATTTTPVASQVTGPDGSDTTDPTDAGPSEDPQDYVDQLAADISEGAVATKEQGECIGERWVEVIGFDALSAAGVSPAQFSNLDAQSFEQLDLSEADASSLYDAFDDCDLDVVKSIRSTFGQGLSATQQACIDDLLTDDLVRDLFVTNLVAGNEQSAGRTEALEACAKD